MSTFFRTPSVLIAALFFSLALSVPIAPVRAAQAPPQIITYQGRLTDASGNLLGGSSGTTYYFKFSIWTSGTVGAGTRVWPSSSPSSIATTVKNGIFTVQIGDTDNGYPSALDLDFSAYPKIYLQTEVSSDNATFETIAPRQQITAVAFAQTAGAVIGTATPSAFGTTTEATNAFVTIAATSTNSVALSLAAVSNQVGNLLQALSSAGTNLFSIGATGGVTMSSATSTSFFATTASSTNLFASNLSIGSLSGILKATAGVIGSALVNLASDVTGTLPIANGGTGTTTAPVSQVLYGGSGGVYRSVATTTLTGNNGLTLSAGAGALVGGGSATIGLASIAANSLLGNSTGASGVPTAVATSTLSVGGNAGTATKLQTARTINGVSFDGSANVTVTAASSTALADSSTFSGTNTFSTLPILSTLSGLIGGNSGRLYQIASSSLFGFTPASNAVTISTTYPLSGGGDLSANRTLSLAFGTTTSNTWSGTQTFTNVTINGTCTGCSSGSGITSIGPTGQSQTGSNQTLASSTVTVNGLTYGLTIVGGANTQTFTPTVTGTYTGSAGSVANAITFNNSGSGASSGQTYNGSGAVTISYNTIGAQAAGSYESPLTFNAPLIRSANAVSYVGLATTSQPASSNLLVSNGGSGVYGVATSSIAVGNGISVTSGTLGSQIGGSAVTLGIATNALALTQFAQVAANTLLGNSTGATGNVTAIATSSLNIGGTAGNVTGTVLVSHGGTGVTSFTTNQLHYGNFSQVATTTLTGNNGLTLSAGAGTLVGGANATIGLASIAANSLLGNAAGASGIPTAIATSSLGINFSTLVGTVADNQLASTFLKTIGSGSQGQLAYWGAGSNTLTGVATTSVSCSGTVSCSSFTIIGSSPITLIGSASGGVSGVGTVATSTLEVAGQIPYWTSSSGYPATLSGIATSTISVGNGISVTSGSLGYQLGGSAVTLGIATNALSLTQLPQIAANTLLGNTTGATGNVTAIATSTLNIGGTASNVTGTVAVANGGTGLGSFTANSLLYSNSAGSAFAFAATSTLNIGGNAVNITGIAAVANGGTGWASIQAGAIPYGNGTTRLSTTTQGTGGQVLSWSGGIPTWVATSTFSVVSANGFAGSFTNATNPALTISTSITGVLKGNGTAVSAAANGTDYTLITGTTCSGTDKISAITASGAVTCSADQTGAGGGASDFTWATNYNVLSAATSSPLWVQAGIFASSTTAYPSFVVQQSGSGDIAQFYSANAEIMEISPAYVGLGTSTPRWLLNLATSTAPQLTLGDGGNTNPWSIRSVGGNLYFATSSPTTFATSSVPALSIVSNVNSISGVVGVGTSTPWGKFSVEMGSLHPAFVVSNQGSTTPAFVVSAVNQNGYVGVGTSSPSGLFSINTNSPVIPAPSFIIGSSTGTNFIVTSSGAIGIGTSSPLGIFSIATSTVNGGSGYGAFTVQSKGATTTIGFFVGTSTGLTAGVGVALPASTSQNMIIVGNGKVGASMAIVDGGLCVDADGWCTASTTGRISAKTSTVGASDLAEQYASADALVPGQIVKAAGPEDVGLAALGDGGAVVGVVSTDPGVTLGMDPSGATAGQYPIALSGRVPVKINFDNGPIQIGDPIALSTSTPGVGMRARPNDTTIGIALEAYTATSTGDSIMVFMHLEQGTDVAMLAAQVASSTATSTTDVILGTFSSASAALQNALSDAFGAVAGLASVGVRELGLAVHATLGAFDKVFAKEVHTDQLCVGNVCVTQDQFLKMVQQSGTAAASSAPASLSISVNGPNPVQLSVGDAYSELGATVAGGNNPGAYQIFVNGGADATSSPSLDTSTPTTYILTYVVTDSSGTTASATRSVIVGNPDGTVSATSTAATQTAATTTAATSSPSGS